MLNPPSHINTFIAQAKEQLLGLYPETEAEALVHWWLEEYFGKTALREMRVNGVVPKEKEQAKLNAQLQQLRKGIPLQQILGKAYFLDMELFVNEHVLIPRPETEELVDLVRRTYPKTAALLMLDIGTGSGCIALSLAGHFSKSRITALDVSTGALAVASKNAEALGLVVDFLELDILQAGPEEMFDVLVSNPPYITGSEKEEMHINVLAHEPHGALFVPEEDPLLFYRAIRDYALVHLQTGGRVFLEVNRSWAQETAALFAEAFVVSVQRDMQGNERFVIGVKK